MAAPTFYWHDYETWGADPTRDRASQFAGIRTDWDLNIIGEPLMLYAKPPKDRLPSPEACLITGITPQQAEAEGVSEAEFMKRVHQELAAPGTCGVGYNSIRFDDEVTRFGLYRNFYDAYGREWQNGNSRWDIIDVVRMCYALRPEGIEWPVQAVAIEGAEAEIRPSFRLEELTQANGIAHESAHDALSDVYATIAMAKLIKEKQPKLFEFALGLRKKQAVSKQLNIYTQKPLIHISAMYPSTQGCAAVVMPLAYHPDNKNGVIVYDLSQDPSDLINLWADEIKTRIYTPKAELPEGVKRIALKTVHINKSPMVAPINLLDDLTANRLGIDLAQCREHYEQIRNAAKAGGGLVEKLNGVFARDPDYIPEPKDPELSLYTGGFFSHHDKQVMAQVCESSEAVFVEHSEGTKTFAFEDERLQELVFRYKAHNFPSTLTDSEQQRWHNLCRRQLQDGLGGQSHSLASFEQSLQENKAIYGQDSVKHQILLQLEQWGQRLKAVNGL